MKKIQYILGGIALIVFPFGLHAQKQVKDSTMNRTVIVEQEYTPDILDASKINVLPKVELPATNKSKVEYDATLAPAGHIPVSVMQAYTGKEIQVKALPGYVRLGYGNYGNLDILANYLFMLPNKDRIHLNFQMNGMDGKLDLPENGGEWNSYYYRTRANVDYLHSFTKIDMNIAGNFGVSNFNFVPGAGKQKFTSGDLHFGLKSTNAALPLQFRAETNLMFYERQYDFGALNAQEVAIRTKAQATGALAEGQTVGIDFGMDNMLYKNNGFKNYTSIGLNPHYLFENEDWKVRVGAHVDIAFNFGKSFQVSPDITAQYNFSDSYILYAQAKGGKLQNDFRRLETFCPYGQIMPQLDATYEQVNAALGFKASPISGLWFNLYAGYQNLKNDLYFEPINSNSSESAHYQTLRITQWNTSNIYAGLEVSYDYKDFLSFSASGVYRNWDASNSESPNTKEKVLFFKPAFETNLKINIRPISPVLITLGYQNILREKVADIKAKPVNNLYLGGSYEFFKRLSVYARINNLLNKEYQYYWGYPTEGINFIGGLSFKF